MKQLMNNMVQAAVDLEVDQDESSRLLQPNNDKDKLKDINLLEKSDDEPTKNIPSYSTQFLLTMVCALIHLGIGGTFGFSGVTLPQLTEKRHHIEPSELPFINHTWNNYTSLPQHFHQLNDFPVGIANQSEFVVVEDPPVLNAQQAAFFSSASLLGAALGSILSGPLMVWLGPRGTLILCLPFTFFSWIILAAIPYVPLLMAARILLGFTIGIMSLAAWLYVVEVSHYRYRGPLSGAVDMARNLGVLFVFGVGYSKIWWRYQALICGCITTVPSFIGLLFLPSSPRWLATKGRIDDAKKSLRFYRGPNYDITKELHNIQVAKGKVESNSISSQFKSMKQPHIIRLIGLLFIVAISTQTTGNFAVIAYAVPIIQEAVPTINPYTGAILLGLFRTFGGIIYMGTSTKFGRRITYLISSLICSVSLILLGSDMYMKEMTDYPEWLWWLPITSLLIFTGTVSIAIPVSGLLVGELLPLNCRALAYGIIEVIFYSSGFIVSFTFPYLKEAIHPYGIFWFYAVCTAILAGFPMTFLPETLGKHLEEIEIKLFNKKSIKRNNYDFIPGKEHNDV